MSKRGVLLALGLVLGGCVPPGQHQGGGYDPGPPPPAAPGVDVNGQWHLESAEDGTGRTGKGAAWVSQIGTLLTARITPTGGGADIQFTGTIAGDGSFHGTYMAIIGGVQRQASMSGQIKSRSEIAGRWAVPGHAAGGFRWVR